MLFVWMKLWHAFERWQAELWPLEGSAQLPEPDCNRKLLEDFFSEPSSMDCGW